MFAKSIARGANVVAAQGIIGAMTNSILDTPGARIKWARMRQRKTQKALGREVGVKDVYISQLESGRYRGGRGLMVRLAAANAWLRAHLRVWLKDKEPLLIEWL